MSPLRPFLFAAFNLACSGVLAATGVASTFDTDADGWYVSDYLGNGVGPANWIAGVIQTGDQFGETSFHAPSEFNGDWAHLYGSTLTFDLTETSRDSAADAYYTAIIASGTDTLYWYGGAPTPVFTTFVAPLSELDTRWRFGGSGFNPASGSAPTAAQFQSVLGNITRLQINAEFITGADNTRLDNVILGPVPEAQTYLLLALGLCVVGGAKARQGRAALSGPTQA